MEKKTPLFAKNGKTNINLLNIAKQTHQTGENCYEKKSTDTRYKTTKPYRQVQVNTDILKC